MTREGVNIFPIADFVEIGTRYVGCRMLWQITRDACTSAGTLMLTGRTQIHLAHIYLRLCEI